MQIEYIDVNDLMSCAGIHWVAKMNLNFAFSLIEFDF